ncbi:PREDICTED: armadillo repeat-containing protein 2-like, partial [Amphimedon queenslandica]
MLESIRVLGNLTRDKSVRDLISDMRIDEILLTLLDSKHVELVYAVCGVLVNVTMEPGGQCIHVFKNNNGVKKLLDVLSHFSRQDWLLSSLACKVLWNYSEGMTNINEHYTEEEVITLFHLLEEYL